MLKGRGKQGVTDKEKGITMVNEKERGQKG